MSQKEINKLVSRVNALEQNVVTIHKDVEFVQREVRDMSGEDAKVDLADTDEIVSLMKRMVDVEEQVTAVFAANDIALTGDERCLIHMYRFLMAHGKGAPKMRILVRSDGFMTMGHHGE